MVRAAYSRVAAGGGTTAETRNGPATAIISPVSGQLACFLTVSLAIATTARRYQASASLDDGSPHAVARPVFRRFPERSLMALVSKGDVLFTAMCVNIFDQIHHFPLDTSTKASRPSLFLLGIGLQRAAFARIRQCHDLCTKNTL